MSPSFAHPLPWRADFDPLSVPAVPAGDREVRSARWLADATTDREELQEYLRERVRDCLGNDPTDADLKLQPRSDQEIRLGFVEQDVVLRLAGREFTLGGGGEPTGQPPFEGPMAVIGSAEPAGRSATGSSVADLQDYLAGRGYECLRATAVDFDRTWTDDCVIVAYTDRTELHAAALAYGQPFVLVWTSDGTEPGTLQLIELTGGLEGRLLAEFPAVLRRLDVRACPVLRDARPGDVCRMHGGPWVSRSVQAAANWERRRARMIRALGCDTCANGSFTVVGSQLVRGRRAVLTGPQPPASNRYQRAIGVDLGEAGPDGGDDDERSGRQ